MPSAQEQIEIMINKLRKKIMPNIKFYFVLIILICFAAVSCDYAYVVMTGNDSNSNNKFLDSISYFIFLGAILINLISNVLLKYSLNKAKRAHKASRHHKTYAHHNEVPPKSSRVGGNRGGSEIFSRMGKGIKSVRKGIKSVRKGIKTDLSFSPKREVDKLLKAAKNPTIIFNSTCTPISYYINKIGKAILSMSPIYFPVALTLSLIQLIMSENSSGNCNTSFDATILEKIGSFFLEHSKWILILAIVFIIIAKVGLLFKGNPIGTFIRYSTHVRDFGYGIIGTTISSVIYTVVVIYVLKMFVTNPFISIINGGQLNEINTNTVNKIFSALFAFISTLFCLGTVLKGRAFVKDLIKEGTKLYDTLITPYFGKDGKFTKEEYKASSCNIRPLESNIRAVSKSAKF